MNINRRIDLIIKYENFGFQAVVATNVIFTVTRIALLARPMQYNIHDRGHETTFVKFQD